MKKNSFGVHFVALITLFLTACGGGGSEDKPQTVRINEVAEVSVAEGDVAEFDVPNDIKSITAIDGDANLTLSFSGRSLIVKASQLTSPTMGTYDVYMSKGNDIVIQRYEVMGVNTSALATEVRAYEIKERYEDLLELSEDKKVHEFFIDLAYLKEQITPSQRDSRISAFQVAQAPSYEATKVSFDELLFAFEEYLSGNLDESSLEGYVKSAESALAAHSDAGLVHLRRVEDLSGPLMDSLPEAKVVYVESQSRFSRYFDHSMLTGDQNYTDGFEILAPLTGL